MCARAHGSDSRKAEPSFGWTGADQFPQVNGNASYTRELISPKGVVGLLGSSKRFRPPRRPRPTGWVAGRAEFPASATGGTRIPPFDPLAVRLRCVVGA